MKKILILVIFVITNCFFIEALADEIANSSYQSITNNLTPQVIKIPGGKIEYYRFGHGTPLVLITGYFANVKSWNMPFLKSLAALHDVIIFDNRNVGGSVNSSTHYAARDLADDLHYLLKALNLSHINLLGISMGGMIAQQFAIAYPKSVDHLILINTFIAGIPPTLPSQQVTEDLYNQPHGKFRQYLMALRILFPPQVRTRMFFVFIRDRFNPHTEEAKLSPTVIKQQQALVLAWMKDTAALLKIRQLKMPVLILSGGSDYVIPYSNSNVLNKEISHSKLIRWQDGGHAMIFQYPESIANTINQWLQH